MYFIWHLLLRGSRGSTWWLRVDLAWQDLVLGKVWGIRSQCEEGSNCGAGGNGVGSVFG